jgi:hypothetical protein
MRVHTSNIIETNSFILLGRVKILVLLYLLKNIIMYSI